MAIVVLPYLNGENDVIRISLNEFKSFDNARVHSILLQEEGCVANYQWIKQIEMKAPLGFPRISLNIIYFNRTYILLI